MLLDHTIVPTKSTTAAVRFFANIFGRKVTPGRKLLRLGPGRLLEVMAVPGELGEPPLGGELPLVEAAQLVERGRLSRCLVLAHPSDAGEAQRQP